MATGHATLYWDTGWNDVLATLSAGRYLAKDLGVTVQLSRVFKNGVTVGAFFSKTNVSSAQFGEGSFDKGVFVSIPFDAFLTRSSNTIASFVWKPLTRDGGAKLGRSAQLYDLTGPRSDRTLRFESAPPPNHATIPADRRDAWTPPPEGPEPYLRVSPKPAAEQWTREASHEDRLMEALYRQEFRNIRIAYDGSHRLLLTLANDRIRPLSRAAGRAARTALRLAPLEVREIREKGGKKGSGSIHFQWQSERPSATMNRTRPLFRFGCGTILRRRGAWRRGRTGSKRGRMAPGWWWRASRSIGVSIASQRITNRIAG